LIGHDGALQAIDLWENTFGSDQPLLRGLPQFAELVVSELRIPVPPRDLAVSLLQALQWDEATLPADPGITSRKSSPPPALQAQNPRLQSAVSAAARPSALVRTLSVLIVKLCDCAGQADRRSQLSLVKSFVAGCSEQSRAIANDVATLLNGRSNVLQLEYEHNNAVTVVNAFYVALAEVYGPISADRILTRAVQATQEQPEAVAFSPRDLL
jgi:hypothetical protein